VLPGVVALPGEDELRARAAIEEALRHGRNAMAIRQDLVDRGAFPAGYPSVMRFVRRLRGATAPEACGTILTAPGEEAQVDYGDGPMVRSPQTGKYRRTRLFLLTLGYSRKSVRLLTVQSSTRTWAELHELDGDALAEPLEPAHGPALEGRGRWRHRAQQEGARRADAAERLAHDARGEALAVDDDVGPLGHRPV
jgi:hypothetical protein